MGAAGAAGAGLLRGSPAWAARAWLARSPFVPAHEELGPTEELGRACVKSEGVWLGAIFFFSLLLNCEDRKKKSLLPVFPGRRAARARPPPQSLFCSVGLPVPGAASPFLPSLSCSSPPSVKPGQPAGERSVCKAARSPVVAAAWKSRRFCCLEPVRFPLANHGDSAPGTNPSSFAPSLS